MISSLLSLTSPRLPSLVWRGSTFLLNPSRFVPAGQTNGFHTGSPLQSAKSSMFPGFEAVYVSPHIRQIRAACRLRGNRMSIIPNINISRLKVYQTILVVGMIPTSLLMLEREMILPSHVGYVIGRRNRQLFFRLSPLSLRFLNLLRGCARGSGGVLQEVCWNNLSE